MLFYLAFFEESNEDILKDNGGRFVHPNEIEDTHEPYKEVGVFTAPETGSVGFPTGDITGNFNRIIPNSSGLFGYSTVSNDEWLFTLPTSTKNKVFYHRELDRIIDGNELELLGDL